MRPRQLLRLYALYARMDLAYLLRDTRFALLGICADTLSNLAAVGGIFLLAWRFDGVGGMSRYEVLFMLGYVTLVTGSFQAFWSGCNTGHISRRIGRGQVDHMLMQPVPIPFQLMTEGFLPCTGISNLLVGVTIVAVALARLERALAWWWPLALLAQVCVSLAIVLGQSYLFSAVAFYAPVAAEEISSTIINLGSDLSQYPLSGMPRALQYPLVTLLPAGLLGWFPALALLGKPPLHLPAWYPAALAALLLLLAQHVFRKGWTYYAQTGANRYLPYGHRR